MKPLITAFLIGLCTLQVAAQQRPSKAQMAADQKKFEAAKKQLDEQLKKMDPETRKQFEQMMGDVDANTAMKNAEKGLDYNAAPGSGALRRDTDPERIPEKMSTIAIPATPQNKDQLAAYLQPIFSETGKLLKPASKNGVKHLLNKGEKTGRYAMVFWANNELDKALYLLLNTCVTQPDDMVALNNLAALLTISGYAHKSMPLLLYAQKRLPGSGTIAGNTGQAYLSLGNVERAKSSLLTAVDKDSTNAEAYRSLALIAHKQGNNALCAGYLEKAISHGGASQDNIKLLQQVSPPNQDRSGIYYALHNNFKQYYKDHSITKRFMLPEVPGSYQAAVATYPDIDRFFADLEATIVAAGKAGAGFNKQYETQLANSMNKRMAQARQVAGNVGQPGAAQMARELKAAFSNPPFFAQATFMLNAIDNPQFSASYISRMKKETANRLQTENQLKQTLKQEFEDKIEVLYKESSKLNTGDGGGADNKRAMEIEREICRLQTAKQEKWLAKSAELNNLYIRNMEKLLNQRLQEYLFWNSIAFQAGQQDPTAVNYAAYVGYLQHLKEFRAFFPYYIDGLKLRDPGDCGKYFDEDHSAKGKVHEWEREHCEVDFGFDAKVVAGKFNCEGWAVFADLKAGEFTYTRSVDPVTWETTGHSLSAKAGKQLEFDLSNNLGGTIGGSVETTIKFDGNMNPVDLVVQGAAGAGINGPMGGSAAVDLGSVTVSVSGGMNSAGPGFTGFGSSFLK